MLTPLEQHASNVPDTLQDMIELQMYLMAQPHRKPWPLLSRSAKPQRRRPFCQAVDASIVEELVNRGFIEQTSSQTFVVSKSGREFYLRQVKPDSDEVSPGGTPRKI